MGNSQFNSSKDGEGGSGRDDGGYEGYRGTRTTPGAPGPFSDAGFAPALRAGEGGGGVAGRASYAGGGIPVVGGGPGMGDSAGGSGGGGSGGGSGGGVAGDDMDVESKADEGEEEVRCVLIPSSLMFSLCSTHLMV